MTPRARLLLWTVIAVGLTARFAIGFSSYGVAFDVEALELVREGLGEDPLHVYSDSNRWPYPPGYFAWILLAGAGEGLLSLSFEDLCQAPPILADGALAWVVQHWLGLQGRSERVRLMAAGLVALGPAFAVVSGYHSQIDSLAILPAVLGAIAWTRMEPGSRRALVAGLLIGVGASIKTVPLIVVLALLPSARSFREALTLVGAAVALPALGFLAFALADPTGVKLALRYRGVPGAGGISLLVQPELARVWMNEADLEGTGITNALLDLGGLITIAVVAMTGLFLYRHRPEPMTGAALLYLAVWAFGLNFFLQYLIWGLPFLLMAGYVRAVLATQVLMLPAAVLVYLRPWEDPAAAPAYAVAALALWVGAVAGFILLARRIAATGGSLPPRAPWGAPSEARAPAG